MIVYADTTRPSAPRWPSWLDGAADICRRESEGGDMYAITDPMVFPLYESCKWLPIGDGWQVANAGRTEMPSLFRQRGDCGCLAVSDARGGQWAVPAVLSPQGAVQMAVPLACVDGRWSRQPTDEQAAIIHAATSARDEILAGRLAQLPLAAAASWCCTLLAAVYYAHPQAFGALGLMDDRLIPQVLLAAAGMPMPEG